MELFNTVVDATFSLQGEQVPLDHSYILYAALSRHVPGLHAQNGIEGLSQGSGIGVFAIRGEARARLLSLTPRSSLRLRVSTARLGEVMTLIGATVEVGGNVVRIGVPRVLPLTPASTVAATLVVIKPAHAARVELTAESFLGAARRRLAGLGIGGSVSLPVHSTGPRSGQPRRRVLRIKGATRVGYAVMVSGLSADESLRLQAAGLGGRRAMGCGLFLPARGSAS